MFFLINLNNLIILDNVGMFELVIILNSLVGILEFSILRIFLIRLARFCFVYMLFLIILINGFVGCGGLLLLL